MTDYIAAAFLLVGFVICFLLLGVAKKSLKIFSIAKDAALCLKDRALTDLEKERILQSHAKSLFYLFFITSSCTLIAILIPFGVLWLCELVGLISIPEVIALSLSWEFIIVSAILISLAVFVRQKYAIRE